MTAQTHFENCYKHLLATPLSHWLETLPGQISQWQDHKLHGDFKKWCKLIDKLPRIDGGEVNLDTQVSILAEISQFEQKQIHGLLKQFIPWRKGPFSIHGVEIDTEWRSDWKWDRVAPHLSNLSGRRVLDVGCGSGYHMWRMLGQSASSVIGIDPTQLFLIQFWAIKHFLSRSTLDTSAIHFLPIGIEQMQGLHAFDTVFSMGVLYHRRDPIQFLTELKNQLRIGGELVLETLVVDGDAQTVLMAGDRYAQMRNVWFLPSPDALIVWLQRVGFTQCRLVDINTTSLDEQRATEWMPNQSLVDFLDKNNNTKTIEGYPAPKRAVIIAQREK